MKTITRRKKHNKNTKTKKKYIKRGGNNEKLEKLKNLAELSLQHVYYRIYPNKDVFEDLPESEWKPDHFGMVKKRKYVRTYSFEEYMDNKIPEIPLLNRNQLILEINKRCKHLGYAYKLLPINVFSDEYMKYVDNMIEIRIKKNDILSLSSDLTHSLYLEKIIRFDDDDFYNMIDYMLEEIYNIHHDDDDDDDDDDNNTIE